MATRFGGHSGGNHGSFNHGGGHDGGFHHRGHGRIGFGFYPYYSSFYGSFYPGYGNWGYYPGYGYGGYGNGRGYAAGRGGNYSPAVQVQSALADLGYYRGRVDGVIGNGTRNAVRAFQLDRVLPATGRIDERLLDALDQA